METPVGIALSGWVMRLKHKVALALAAYGILAFLAWHTLSEVRLREFVWVVLGFFAVKSVLFWYRSSLVAKDTNGAARETQSVRGRE